MSQSDKLEQIYIMIGSELKSIGEKPYNDGSIQSYISLSKLDAYANVLSCMGFTKEAVVKIYSDFNIDYSYTLNPEYS